MDTPDGRAVARAKVSDEMAERGWNVADLARAARIDLGTAGDFLNGSRWPHRATQNKIETTFDWWPGSIAWWARGEEPPVNQDRAGTADTETVGGGDQDDAVLASLPAEALEGLDAAERAEVIAAAKLSALQTARAIRRRLDDER